LWQTAHNFRAFVSPPGHTRSVAQLATVKNTAPTPTPILVAKKHIPFAAEDIPAEALAHKKIKILRLSCFFLFLFDELLEQKNGSFASVAHC
jgi:hypothetical protein